VSDYDRAVLARLAKAGVAELLPAYRGRLTSWRGPAERPSLVWRGDSVVLGLQAPRWAWRVWLAEGDRKVGFANLRPLHAINPAFGTESDISRIPATADAYLAAPGFMTRDAGYRLYPASDFGRFYGEKIDAPVTCFSMPHRQAGGFCAQAALLMCLVMLARRDVRVPAVHETSYEIARSAGYRRPRRTRDVLQNDGSFKVRGLFFDEIQQYVEGSALIGASAVYDWCRADDPRTFSHLVQQYLRQNVAVILAVDYARLYPEKRKELYRRYGRRREYGHAVVVLGVRHGGRSPVLNRQPLEYIYHDSATGPYLGRLPARLLLAAGHPDRGVRRAHMLVALPKGVRRPLSDLFRVLRLCRDARDQELRREAGCVLRPVRGGLLRFRLNRSDEVEERYFHALASAHPVRQRLQTSWALLPEWLWAVEWYEDASAVRDDLACGAWFFDATVAPPRAAWRPAAVWDKGFFWCQANGVPSDALRVDVRLRVRNRGLEL